MALTVIDRQARSIECSWTPPSLINGRLLKYVLVSTNATNGTKDEWEGLDLTVSTVTFQSFYCCRFIVDCKQQIVVILPKCGFRNRVIL